MEQRNWGHAGSGGLVRNKFGSWIKGFAVNTGLFFGQSRIIGSGCELEWMLGFQKLILESDSKLVVHLITREYGELDSNFSLIIKAKELPAREWVVKVQHAFREANAAAYWLDSLGLSTNPLYHSFRIQAGSKLKF